MNDNITNIINMNNSKIYIREYNRKKVITAWDIATIHNKEPRHINVILKYNIKNFNKGNDYFKINKKEFLETFKDFKNMIPNNIKYINLFTATGYLKIVKSFQIRHDYEKLKKIYKLLNGKENINMYTSNIPNELYFNESLFEAFKSLNIKVIHQFQIDIYRVDFYIPEYNVVIEYDEEYHKSIYYQDILRENKIKEKINCSFIRCNAKDKDIKNIMKILNHIFMFKPKIPKTLEEQYDEFIIEEDF